MISVRVSRPFGRVLIVGMGSGHRNRNSNRARAEGISKARYVAIRRTDLTIAVRPDRQRLAHMRIRAGSQVRESQARLPNPKPCPSMPLD